MHLIRNNKSFLDQDMPDQTDHISDTASTWLTRRSVWSNLASVWSNGRSIWSDRASTWSIYKNIYLIRQSIYLINQHIFLTRISNWLAALHGFVGSLVSMQAVLQWSTLSLGQQEECRQGNSTQADADDVRCRQVYSSLQTCIHNIITLLD